MAKKSTATRRKAARRTTRRTRGVSALNQYLHALLRHARHDESNGDERTKKLEEDLQRIAGRVDETLVQINKEAEESDSPDSDARIRAKLERTMQILDEELMLLAAIYHRQKDVNKIKSFLGEQREIISQSMDGGEEGTASLDNRIEELHKLMAAERLRIKRSARSERLKFMISLAIALASLSLSVYALTRR